MNLNRWCHSAVRATGAAALAVTMAWAGSASAQVFSITIRVDENCNGTLTNTAAFFSALPCSQVQDPGPGGLAGALTYGLLNPPGMVAGDLLLAEPGGGNSDWIRFNPQQNGGSLVFYSDNADGVDALADLGPPAAFYTNLLTIPEVGLGGGLFGASYTPTAGQPGFVAGAGGPVTYILISDSEVPEPATVALLGLGLAGLAAARRRKST